MMRGDLSLTPAVRLLVWANIIAYALKLFVGYKLVLLFGLAPAQVLGERWVWQPATYMFLHSGPWHLLLNLFALWMFGRVVESEWGEKEFLKYYFLCGLGAAAAYLVFQPASTVPLVGASGGVYGLLVAFALMYPDQPIYLYFLMPVKAKYMALLFGLIELVTLVEHGGTSSLAHLGGMVTGFLYLRWWWEVRTHAKDWFRSLAARLPGGGGERPAKARRRREEPQDDTAEVDRILDKILVQGVDSLTAEEKRVLERHSKRQGGGPFHA